MKKIAGDVLALGLFVSLSFYAFRFHIPDFPHAAQYQFMQQREAFSSDWEFFKSAISLNRTRELYPQDPYLFRPLLMSTLAILDIFFRTNLWVSGSLSILWHALVCFVLYLLIRAPLGRRIALVIASSFIFAYQGMTLVLWRHVSPYLLALFFFCLGLWAWNRESLKGRHWLVPFLFFISLLFHEILGIALVATGILYWISTRARAKEVLVTFMAPAFVYGALNVIDYWVRRPGHFFWAPDQKGFAAYSWQMIGGQFINTVAWFSELWFLPSRLSFKLAEVGFPVAAPILVTWKSRTLAVGVITVALVCCWCAWKRLKAKENILPATSVLLLSLYVVVLFLGLLVGRVLQHDSYLHFSTYYFYFFGLLWVLGCAYFIPILPLGAKYQRGLAAAFAVFMVVNALGNQGRLTQFDKTLNESSDVSRGIRQTADSVLEMARSLKTKRENCYGGWVGGNLLRHAPVPFKVSANTLLYRQSCQARPASHPLYLQSDDQGELVWIELGTGEISPVPLLQQKGANVWLSGAPLPFDGLTVTLADPAKAGIVVGYRSARDFVSVRFTGDLISVREIMDGKPLSTLNQPLVEAVYPLGKVNARNVTLQLRKVGDALVVLRDRQVIHQATILGDGLGQIGVFGDGRYVTDFKAPTAVFPTAKVHGPVTVEPLASWMKERLRAPEIMNFVAMLK